MNRNDLDQILAIERSSFSNPWSKQTFEAEISGENKFAYYLVARCKDEVVGYLGAWFILSEVHITNIAVKPSHRRRGIAKKLINFLITQAKERGVTAVTLEVRVSNYPAQKLYRKLGFKEVGVRPKYYQDNNEDALIMWKVLTKKKD
ncbi:ribosomal protein S18-alanine N-acetyltransferase [Anoxybacter fermentans]